MLDSFKVDNVKLSYGLVQWLSNVGGLGGAVSNIFGLLATLLSYQIFIKTVLGNLFTSNETIFKDRVDDWTKEKKFKEESKSWNSKHQRFVKDLERMKTN